MSTLSGKVAVVTGASKGIGAAIAQGLAAAGAAVVVNYASSQDGADRVVADIAAAGGRAAAVQANISNAADVRRLFEEARAHFGPVDVLVNNAGVYAFGPLESVTEAEFRRHFETNVWSVFLTTQEAAKQFGPDGGSIVNVATAGVALAGPYSSLYTATKSAVVAITRVLAKELGPRNIRVNAIAPGGTATEGLAALGFLGSEQERQMVAATPLGRLGTPADIAPVAVFLASDAARWITGDTLFASGGLQ